MLLVEFRDLSLLSDPWRAEEPCSLLLGDALEVGGGPGLILHACGQLIFSQQPYFWRPSLSHGVVTTPKAFHSECSLWLWEEAQKHAGGRVKAKLFANVYPNQNETRITVLVEILD